MFAIAGEIHENDEGAHSAIESTDGTHSIQTISRQLF